MLRKFKACLYNLFIFTGKSATESDSDTEDNVPAPDDDDDEEEENDEELSASQIKKLKKVSKGCLSVVVVMCSNCTSLNLISCGPITLKTPQVEILTATVSL